MAAHIDCALSAERASAAGVMRARSSLKLLAIDQSFLLELLNLLVVKLVGDGNVVPAIRSSFVTADQQNR